MFIACFIHIAFGTAFTLVSNVNNKVGTAVFLTAYAFLLSFGRYSVSIQKLPLVMFMLEILAWSLQAPDPSLNFNAITYGLELGYFS